jgi:hypothetical protein
MSGSSAGARGMDRRLMAVFVVGAVLIVLVGLAIAGGFGNPGTVVATGTPAASSTLTADVSLEPTTSAEPGATGTAAPSQEPAATTGPTPVPTAAPTAHATPKPTATPNTAPAINVFNVPANIDCTDQAFSGFIHISWSVVRATGVTLSIDGNGIYDSYANTTDAADVPFSCGQVFSHTYKLTTTGGTGPAATSTKTSKAYAPKIVSFTVDQAASCPQGATIVYVNVSYQIAYATGATLYYADTQGGLGSAVYTTFVNKEYANYPVMFDCSKAERWFRLTTSGGFGPAASLDRKVTRAS